MSDEKRLYIVVTSTTGDNNGMTCSVFATKRDAQSIMVAFVRVNDPSAPEPTGMSASGCCTVTNPCDGGNPIPNGNTYSCRIFERDIDPEDFKDAVSTYQVEIEITKKYIVKTSIEARDEYAARDAIEEKFEDAEFDDDIQWDYPDDTSYDLLDIEQSDD